MLNRVRNPVPNSSTKIVNSYIQLSFKHSGFHTFSKPGFWKILGAFFGAYCEYSNIGLGLP